MILELTFPDADPWDPSNYDVLLDQVKEALINTPNVSCSDVRIREAENIGPADDYEVWRGGWKYDFSSFDPNTSYIFGVSYPVAPVDATELAQVWEVLSKAEGGELKHANIAIAIGQVLQPESDALAIIARVHILRALQARKAIATQPLAILFERAARVPIESRIESEPALDALAGFFNDSSR